MRGTGMQGKFCLCVALALAGLAFGESAAADEPRALYQPKAVPGVPKKMPEPFAVLAFENRSGVTGLDWMSAAVPFIVGEKAELHRGLRPSYGPLVVPEGVRPAPVTPDAVVALSKKTGARWVWTGWFARPDWELQLAISLWKVEGGKATRVDEVIRRGEFKSVHAFIAESIEVLTDKAKMPLDSHARAAVKVVPTRDFYAFTLFGRGLDALAGVTAEPDPSRVEKSLPRVVFIDPNFAEGWRVLGLYYAGLGKDKLAESRVARALDLRADYYPALLARAEMLSTGQKVDQAAELYEQAVILRPWAVEPRYRLGAAYWELTRIDEAYRELKRVVEVDGDHVRARRLLVMIHAAKGQGADLVRELEQVSTLDPTDASTRMDLAAAYVSVGRDADAVKTYDAVLKADPKNVQALKFLGDLSKQRGDTAKAVELYQRAIAVKPTDPRPYFLLGALYVQKGDDAAAQRIYQKAQRFPAYQAEVFNNLGAISYRAGRLEESLWYLRRAVTKKPNRSSYRYNLALSLSASGDAAEALEHVDASLQLDPGDSETHYLRGVVLLRLGRVDEAEKEFRTTLAAVPGHKSASHNLEMIEQLARRAREGEVVIEGR